MRGALRCCGGAPLAGHARALGEAAHTLLCPLKPEQQPPKQQNPGVCRQEARGTRRGLCCLLAPGLPLAKLQGWSTPVSLSALPGPSLVILKNYGSQGFLTICLCFSPPRFPLSTDKGQGPSEYRCHVRHLSRARGDSHAGAGLIAGVLSPLPSALASRAFFRPICCSFCLSLGGFGWLLLMPPLRWVARSGIPVGGGDGVAKCVGSGADGLGSNTNSPIY